MTPEAVFPMTSAAAAPTVTSASVPLRAASDDGKTESSFKQTYVYKTYLKDDEVTIAAKDGVVSLTGTVATQSHRALAQETAASLPGVVRVDNELVTQGEAAAQNADVWMGRKVKLTLLFHRNVSAGNTIVEVKDSIVTLKGEASSGAQKELTTEYTKDVDGVKEVKNEMTVAAAAKVTERSAGEKVDDASVTAQVRTVLWTHRSTNALKTKVETRDGEVLLTGIAKNAAEKSLVTKLVTDIQGVTSVRNQMTVEVPLSK